MAEHLFIKVKSDSDDCSWVIVDGEGRLLEGPQTGPIESAAQHASGRRVALVAPGLDVVTTQAEVPATSQARMRQMVPYSVEDSFAEDVDNLAFAVGPRLESGAVSVAVTAKEKLEDWLARADDVQIKLSAVYPETDGLPDTPSTLNLLVDGDTVFGRKPGQPPIVLQGLSLSQAFDLLVDADDESAPQHALIYIDSENQDSAKAELALIESRLSSLNVKLTEDGSLPLFAAKLANSPGTNLLQGDYATKSDWAGALKPWRLAASLVAGLMAVSLLAMGAEYLSLRMEDGRLTEAVERECQNQFSATALSQCQALVQNALRLAGDSSIAVGDGFLATLGTLAEFTATDERFEMLSYRNQIMSLQMVAPDVAALDRFRQDVSDTGRFEVTIQSTNPEDDAVEGRIQIVGVPQ